MASAGWEMYVVSSLEITELYISGKGSSFDTYSPRLASDGFGFGCPTIACEA